VLPVLFATAGLGLCGATIAASSAAGADFTWSGEAPAGEPNWSNGANWVGGAAPSGSVGALNFPQLSSTSCGNIPQAACYTTTNNVPGLVANSISFGETSGGNYSINGEGFTVGAGGVKVMTGTSGVNTAEIAAPLTLASSQTWELGEFARLRTGAGVTGGNDSLGLYVPGEASLTVAGNMEVGPVSVTGTGTLAPEGDVNGTDGHSVTLHGARLVSPERVASPNGSTIGPLTSIGGEINSLIGEYSSELTVNGGITFDSTSTYTVRVEIPQRPFGPLIDASGPVSLGGAKLSFLPPGCGSPPVGEVYTLIKTSGSLSGTFDGIPNGGTLNQQDGYCLLEHAVLRINYTAHAVTATVVSSTYASRPYGGALTQLELLGGGHNSSEFCLTCFMGKLISFILPVDAATGNFWHTFDDLRVPGRGIALDLNRTYNSGAAGTDSPFGFGWSFPYDMSLSFPDATHVVVNQENGSQVAFTEQSGGTYTAPPRVTAALVHNADGSWTFVRRHKDTFSFDNNGRLTQEKDLNGYVTALAYNGSGQLSTVTDPAGQKLTFAYTGNHISSVTDPLGREVRYAYNGEGDLTDVIDVNGGNTHFTYDSSHRMLTMRFPNQAPDIPGSTGAVVANKYDGQGRVIEQTDQLGRITKFEYNGEPLSEAGGTTTITDPKGDVIVQYYQFGELLAETKGYGTEQAATWSFGYDPATLGMTSITDPNGHTTTSTFDSEGNTLSTTDALGRTTTNTYDSLNDLLTTTDPLAVTTTMTYDAHGNLLSRSRPLNGTSEVQTTTYAYGDGSHPGDVTAMTDAEGKTWKYTYDANGDRTSTTDPLDNKTTSTYNAVGWLMSTTSPRGDASGANPASFSTMYAHNNFGQVTETVDPLGHKTTSQYDPDQDLIASTDAAGNTTTYTYDAAGEQTAVHRADGTSLQTTYWPDGSVKEQIDGAGHATGYVYDPLGRESAVTDPLGRTTHYEYDPAGNRTTITDAEGRVTTTTYDAANEPTSIAYSDGKTPNVTEITYDADGQRTGQTDGSGTWSWSWDSLHRRTSVTEGNNGTVKYQYDLRNDPTAITYPNGKTVTRGYDAAGHWTSVTDWLGHTTNFAYDPDGNLTTETLPVESGITDNYTYAADDSLTAINDTRGPARLFQASYTRDANRQLTGDSSQPASEGGYGYTALNQLCDAGTEGGSCSSPPSGATQYQFDSADNLTHMSAATQTYDAADELTSVSTPVSGSEGQESATSAGGGGQQPGTYTGVLGSQEGHGTPAVTSGKVKFAHTGKRPKRTISQTLSTKTAGDLVLAFLSVKGLHRGQHPVVAGGGLRWAAITNASGSGGNLAVWQARAPKPVKHIRITAKLGQSGATAALAVVGFDNGASVVNASTAAKRSRSASVAAVVPPNTVVWTLGQDASHGKIKPLAGQTLLTNSHAPGGSTSWLQSYTPPAAGRIVVGGSTHKPTGWILDAVTIQERSTNLGGVTAASPPLPAKPITPPASPGATLATFTYDGEGDRSGYSTSGGAAVTFGYNQDLELTSAGSKASYSYNGGGLRMTKTIDGATAPFIWDIGGGMPLLLGDGTNSYVYGPGGVPLEQVDGTTALWLHHDQLGSTRMVTNSTGQVAATYAYSPYGSLSSSSGSVSTSLLFAGQYLDNETGLYYLRARYYDPATAQFLTRDPAFGITHNPYGYAGNSPANGGDPTGKCGLWGDDTCLGDVIGAVSTGVSDVGGAIGNVATTAWNDTGGQVVNFVQNACIRNPFGEGWNSNNNGGCQTVLTGSQGAQLAGAAVLIGTGAVAEVAWVSAFAEAVGPIGETETFWELADWGHAFFGGVFGGLAVGSPAIAGTALLWSALSSGNPCGSP
jgi:RHS repeat-associated protein